MIVEPVTAIIPIVIRGLVAGNAIVGIVSVLRFFLYRFVEIIFMTTPTGRRSITVLVVDMAFSAFPRRGTMPILQYISTVVIKVCRLPIGAAIAVTVPAFGLRKDACRMDGIGRPLVIALMTALTFARRAGVLPVGMTARAYDLSVAVVQWEYCIMSSKGCWPPIGAAITVTASAFRSWKASCRVSGVARLGIIRLMTTVTIPRCTGIAAVDMTLRTLGNRMLVV